ncbi:MAG: hypothetical protein JJU02_10675, partial [Cryomorphaceae bacterium]|nr:hypothetical protein [Cryomorphaceae bacterium]
MTFLVPWVFTNFGENTNSMTKIHISNDSIKAFGGLNFVSSEFDAQGLPDLITNILGKRSLLAEYEYSD